MGSETELPVEYLTTARLGEKGQITVPKEYRDALSLEAGAPISVIQIGDGLILIPEQSRFRQLCERIANAFAARGIGAGALLATLPQSRKQIVARHYPELAGKQAKRKKAKS